MRSNPRRAVWPFLLILAMLFVLSVAAPNGWRSHDAPSARFAPSPAASGPVRVEKPSARAEILAPMPTSVADLHLDDFPVVQPFRSSVAPKVTQNRWNDADRELALRPTPTDLEPSLPAAENELELPRLQIASNIPPAAATAPENVLPSQPETPSVTISAPIEIQPPAPVLEPQDKPAAAPAEDEPAPISKDNNAPPADVATQPTAPTQPTAAASPPGILPTSLLERLDALTELADCANWSSQTVSAIHELLDRPVDRTELVERLARLNQLADRATPLAASLKSAGTAAEVRRLQYALIRRLEIWPLILADAGLPDAAEASNLDHLTASLDQVQSLLQRDASAGATWQQYLLIDALRETTHSDGAEAASRRQVVAKQMLQRMASPHLDPAQRKFIHSASFVALFNDLRSMLADGVDPRQLLAEIERYETTRLIGQGNEIAVSVWLLAASADPARKQLAAKLDAHYRNANTRLVVSSELLNRLMPEPGEQPSSVNDVVAGAQVRGRAVTSTRLFVQLIPDRTKLRLALEATGTVNSRTTATSGPAVFLNQGESSYLARKLITYTDRGLIVEPATAKANAARNDVESVNTPLDDVPFVGSMARSMAMSRRDEMQDQANREVRWKVSNAVSQRIDAETGPRLAKAEANLQDKVLKPLKRLWLNPTPISLETTDTDLLLRFRLAASEQLGANTARPRTPNESWLCYQIHESAVNNLIQNLDLAGRSFTPPELQQWIADKTGRPAPLASETLQDTVRCTFAEDAAQVRFDGNQVELTLSIADLRQGRGHWSDFQVRAIYRPQFDGINVVLVRSGSIELIGDRFEGKPQLALRGIFSKVLSPERKIALVPDAIVNDKRLHDLSATQCVFEDGWMSLAIGPSRVALKSVIKR